MLEKNVFQNCQTWTNILQNIFQTSKIVLFTWSIILQIFFKLPKICSLEKHRTESVSTCPSASSSEFSNFLDPSYTWLKHVQLYLNYIYIFQPNLSMTVNTLNRSCSISLSKVRNCLGKSQTISNQGVDYFFVTKFSLTSFLLNM